MSNLLEQASLVMIPSGYKEDIVYSVIPTSGAGDLTFTRASNGTRIDSNGNVEVVPWNLLEQSETIGVSPWGVSGYTQTTNATTAPNGTNTAELFTLNNGNVAGPSYSILQALVLSGEITISVYFKNNNSTGKYVLQTGAGQGSEINVVTLAITNFAGCVGSVENVGNGWYRFSTFIPSASNPYFFSYQDGMTGDGSKGIYLWGAQVNIGALKPYFPTTDRLNVPRLTYQNGGGGCPSLLLEKQSTNLVSYSQDFTNSYWSKLGQGSGDVAVVTANYAISPDGTQNATRFVCNLNGGTTASSRSWMIANFTPQATSTISIWIKLNSVGTKTVLLSDSGGGTKTISGTDWQRIDATFVGAGGEFRIGLIGGSTSDTLDCCIWGAQAESGSYPTSYIPTTSSSATRVADACYKTGISSLIGQTEGVVFWDIDVEVLSATGNENIFNIDAGSYGNTIYLIKGSLGILTAEIYVTGVAQCSFSYSLPSVGRYKMALAYKANDFAFYVNGVSRGTDSSGSVPATSRLQLGNGVFGPSDGKTNQAILFQTRLTNSELAQITGNQNYTINQAYESYGVASESPNCVQP